MLDISEKDILMKKKRENNNKIKSQSGSFRKMVLALYDDMYCIARTIGCEPYYYLMCCDEILDELNKQF